MKESKYRDGVRCLQSLKDRCKLDDVTGCWVWPLGLNVDGSPMVSLRNNEGKHSRVQGRRVSLYLRDGIYSNDKIAVPYKCVNRLCVNPDHAQWMDKADYYAQLAESGVMKGNPLRKAASLKTAVAKRALTDSQVIEIRESSDTIKNLAKQYGISSHTCWAVRKHMRYQDVQSVNVVPAASVFTWRG